jgi:type IV pilus assembly protein PilX
MSHSRIILRSRGTVPSRARGAVLFIALIVLVAMTLAGIAIMRSVDTATLIAGNLAFKQGTVQSSDNGVEVAYQWLVSSRSTLATSDSGVGGKGYISALASPIWSNPGTWGNSVVVGTDGAGNTISYLIHRMCNCANTAYNGNCTGGESNQCALDNPVAASAPPAPGEGESFTVGAPGYLQDPKVYYRITVRSQGPRSTVSYIQAMVAIAL